MNYKNLIVTAIAAGAIAIPLGYAGSIARNGSAMDDDKALLEVRALEHATDPWSQTALVRIERGRADLRYEMRLAKEDRIALTFKELEQLRPQAGTANSGHNLENIYDRVRPGAREVKNAIMSDVNLSVDPLEYTPEQLGAIRRLFVANASTLAAIDDLSDKSEMRFDCHDIDIATGNFIMTTDTGRSSGKILRLEAYLESRDGRGLAAVKTQAREFELAKQFADLPSSETFSAASWIQMDALRGMRDIVEDSHRSSGIVEAVRQSVYSHRLPPTASLALNGDLVLAMADGGFGDANQDRIDQRQYVDGQTFPPSYALTSSREKDLLIGLRDGLMAKYLRRNRQTIDRARALDGSKDRNAIYPIDTAGLSLLTSAPNTVHRAKEVLAAEVALMGMERHDYTRIAAGG